MGHKLTIEIYGSRYPITTTEHPEYTKGLARELDRTLTEVMRGSKMSPNQAMVLVSLHYLDQLKKTEQGADHLRAQVAEYLEDAAAARAELAKVQRKLEKLEHAK